jgi:hypothetical protein
MSDYKWDYCPTCKKFDELVRHKCDPTWEARLEGGGDDEWITVYAMDNEDAAEEFCEKYDRDDEYSIINHGSAVVEVRKREGEEVVKFDVEAETVPQYSARIKKD